MPADALIDTIESYNAFIEFGKELAVPRTDPGKPIARYPIHAIPAIAGITFCHGSLLVNKHGQVLDEEESVIEGLYAAGARWAACRADRALATPAGGPKQRPSDCSGRAHRFGNILSAARAAPRTDIV